MSLISDNQVETKVFDGLQMTLQTLGVQNERIILVSHPLHRLIRISQANKNKFIGLVQDMITGDANDLLPNHFNEWEVCPICLMDKSQRPTIILKLERINEDLKYLSQHFVKGDNTDDVSIKTIGKEFNPMDFVNLLTQFQREELFAILRRNYELFGYNPFQDLLKL